MLLTPWVSAAATLTTAQTTPEYSRVLFTGSSPQTMRVESRGNAVILNLGEATGDVSVLQSKLKPHVVSVERSADGKVVTLNLDKSYRVRQFVSGNSVGLDIITSTPAPISPFTTKVATAPPTASSILSTKEPAAAPQPQAIETQPVAPEPVKPKAAEAAPVLPEPAPAPKPQPAKPVLSTKQIEAPKVGTFTTKEAPAKPKPINEPAKPVARPIAPPKPAMSDDEIQKAFVADSQQTDKKPQATAPEPIPEVIAPTTQSFVPEDIIVGVRNEKDGFAIDFPWSERVATAVFQRSRDIWIVFNKESRIDTARLRTVLPTSITNITRYKMPGNTVIKLETNGSIFPAVESKKGTYHWSVHLLPSASPALKDAAMASNADAPKPHLLFQVFDVANPFSFYDPSIGDRWLVAPLYEPGVGVSNPRRFPAFDIVPSSQGIAILTQRPEIEFEKTRLGLKLGSEKGLNISRELPYVAGTSPVKGSSSTTNVLLPYDRWYVEPGKFLDARRNIMERLRDAPRDMRPAILTELATLYLGQGFGLEAASILDVVERLSPTYYVDKKLAVVRAAAHFMAGHMEDAAKAIKSPELVGVKEAELWKDAIGLFIPMEVRVSGAEVTAIEPTMDPNAPLTQSEQEKLANEQLKQIALNAAIAAKGFDYVGYNNDYIRYYPPSTRQRLGIIAANAYLERSKYGNAVKIFDILNKEGLLEPIQTEAEYVLGVIAAERDKIDEARATWERLADQEKNPKIRFKAAYDLIKLDFAEGKIDLPETIEKIESLRITWRGDAQERDLLEYLGQLYVDNKQYDMALRIWRELTNYFPTDPEVVDITTRTAELFERLFYDGLADELPPLKSLALFYEFRELTPIGEKGNAIIQKLADRLAAVDLIDRAAQLLEHQIKFRLDGEERARVGARLALLYLIDREPQKALDTLEITHYGDMPDNLRFQRLRLSAQALASLDRLEEALAIMHADRTKEGETLRLEILWKMKDWANVINQAEDMMAARKDLTAPLNDTETDILLKLALAYSFEKDLTQLNYLRDYYTTLMEESPYKDIFSYITNNTAPIDPEDFALVTQQISRTESFMKQFRDKIAKGQLSEAVK
ncbi:MAG: hypothetical protein J0M34_01515 [Alphaproteobacteria bacterium]|nr:hypothetical protein [Alphaproteobacteria bacterium]